MNTTSLSMAARVTRSTPVLPVLAWLEIRRYALHPLFLLGVAINVVVCVIGPDAPMSTLGDVIAPASTIGVFGIVIMASLTRSSEKIRTAAGVVPVPERTRSLALVAACLLPFAAGLAWWIWAVVMFRHQPPPANGFPFGPVSDGWAYAVLFGEAPMACLGGPLLGILVGRWIGGRGAPALTAVGTIALCIALQGLFDPLRRIRVVSPWTYWGGPFGAKDDPDRMLLLPGSPYWWIAYLACLCAGGVIAVLLHDREQPRRRLLIAAAGVGAVAVVSVLLAMWTGTPDTLVNPLRS
jgi:hypothetical protein